MVTPLSTSLVTVTSPGPNIGATVGGKVGGVAALVLVIASLLFYRSRRHKGGNYDRPPILEEGAAPYRDILPTVPVCTTSSASPSTPIAFATMVSIPECPPICLHQLIELCVLVNLEK